jgi:hypothetical protein
VKEFIAYFKPDILQQQLHAGTEENHGNIIWIVGLLFENRTWALQYTYEEEMITMHHYVLSKIH